MHHITLVIRGPIQALLWYSFSENVMGHHKSWWNQSWLSVDTMLTVMNGRSLRCGSQGHVVEKVTWQLVDRCLRFRPGWQSCWMLAEYLVPDGLEMIKPVTTAVLPLLCVQASHHTYGKMRFQFDRIIGSKNMENIYSKHAACGMPVGERNYVWKKASS